MLETYFGRFAVQSLIHSFVALVLVQASFRIWEEEDHRTKFFYRVSVLVLPVLLFPLFQFVSPERGSFYFGQDTAVFESLRWFGFRIGGIVSIGWLLLGVVALTTTAVVLVQEIVPMLRMAVSRREDYSACPIDPHVWQMVEELSIALDMSSPNVRILDAKEPVIFTSGARRSTLFLSTGLIRMLQPDQLRGAVAHELAHIRRRSTLTTLVVFLVRLILFYNPVSLLVFRRIVQDDEHVCDDMALALGASPPTLAGTLRLFLLTVPEEAHGAHEMRLALEEHSRNLLLMERINRLESLERPVISAFSMGRFILVLGTVAVVCYHVV